MKTTLLAIILLAATFCFFRIESQCNDNVATYFSAFFMRILKIGEDNSEALDQGGFAYDGIGHRSAYFSESGEKDYICHNPITDKYERIRVDSNGRCMMTNLNYFPEIFVPKVDTYEGEINIGGPKARFPESLYVGEDTRERNEMVFTAAKCGPTVFAFSSVDRNFHFYLRLFNINSSLPIDVFRVKCGSTVHECGASMF